MNAQSHVERASTVGLIITLMYTTCGFSVQAWRILTTGQTPSTWMMLLAAATFASWGYWAWISTPRIWKVWVCNTTGLLGCLIVLALTFWANTKCSDAIVELNGIVASRPDLNDREVLP